MLAVCEAEGVVEDIPVSVKIAGDAALLQRPRRFAWPRGRWVAGDYFTAKQ